MPGMLMLRGGRAEAAALGGLDIGIPGTMGIMVGSGPFKGTNMRYLIWGLPETAQIFIISFRFQNLTIQ